MIQKSLFLFFTVLIVAMALNTPGSAGPLRDRIMKRILARRLEGGNAEKIWPKKLAPGSIKVTMDYGGRSRYYLLHVPLSYTREKAVPLVFVLHGGGGSAGQIEKSKGFDEFSNKDGFIVVYPAGTSRWFKDKLLTWNTRFMDTYADKEDVDDVGFILKILSDISGKYAIDPKRVYATGMSQGGIMTYRLGCEASDKFAAIAPVAGAMITDRCQPTSSVSVLAFHGTADPRIPYNGGPGEYHMKANVSSVMDDIRFWRRFDGIADQPVQEKTIGRANLKLYGPTQAGVEVGVWTLNGQGHAWPGKPGLRPRSDQPNMDINATALISEFFMEHVKP